MMEQPWQTSLPILARKWSKATERGKGIRLAAHELDLLNAAGVGELLMGAAASEQRKLAAARRNQS